MSVFVQPQALSRIKTTVTKNNLFASTAPNRFLSANDRRVGATIVNLSQATLYLDFDATVSASDHMVQLPPGAYYEMPFGAVDDLFGVWGESDNRGRALIRDFIEA